MKNLLKSEIQELAKKILNSNELDNVVTMHDLAKELYEKLTILKFVESNINNNTIESVKEVKKEEEQPAHIQEEKPKEEDFGDSELISTLDENLFVSDEPMADEMIEMATEKIKDIVAQMPPEARQIDDLFNEVIATPELSKNDMEVVTPTQEDVYSVESEVKQMSLNDRLKSGITIGLNDRIAFVKHLFGGSTEDFNRVISQLNTLSSELEALEFLNNMVKPEYDNWQGKEDYEQRFLTFVEGKFA